MSKLVPKQNFIIRLKNGGYIKKFEPGGKTPDYLGSNQPPIGTKPQYNHVISIYQDLVDKGVEPQAALDLVNQKIAERGWIDWSTGDAKVYPTREQFVDHVIDWMGRLYPGSLNAKSFDEYWKATQEGTYKYNSENPNYKQELLKTRPGVKKRINHYRTMQGLSPLAYIQINNNDLMQA